MLNRCSFIGAAMIARPAVAQSAASRILKFIPETNLTIFARSSQPPRFRPRMDTAFSTLSSFRMLRLSWAALGMGNVLAG